MRYGLIRVTQTGAAKKIEDLMKFIADEVLIHLEHVKPPTEKYGVAEDHSITSKSTTTTNSPSFYLKLLCNKKSEWYETQVISIALPVSKFIRRVMRVPCNK